MNIATRIPFVFQDEDKLTCQINGATRFPSIRKHGEYIKAKKHISQAIHAFFQSFCFWPIVLIGLYIYSLIFSLFVGNLAFALIPLAVQGDQYLRNISFFCLITTRYFYFYHLVFLRIYTFFISETLVFLSKQERPARANPSCL